MQEVYANLMKHIFFYAFNGNALLFIFIAISIHNGQNGGQGNELVVPLHNTII